MKTIVAGPEGDDAVNTIARPALVAPFYLWYKQPPPNNNVVTTGHSQ